MPCWYADTGSPIQGPTVRMLPPIRPPQAKRPGLASGGRTLSRTLLCSDRAFALRGRIPAGAGGTLGVRPRLPVPARRDPPDARTKVAEGARDRQREVDGGGE